MGVLLYICGILMTTEREFKWIFRVQPRPLKSVDIQSFDPSLLKQNIVVEETLGYIGVIF